MATVPYARILMSVNGGAYSAGARTVPSGATIAVKGESIAGWNDGVAWEIFGIPPNNDHTAWSGPGAGDWTYDAVAGVWRSTSITPATFVLPADSVIWGKWILRLVVNNGVDPNTGKGKQYDPAGNLLPNQVIDISGGWSVLSPNAGLVDVSPQEGEQFNILSYIRELQFTLRTIDMGIGGSGGTVTMGGDVTGPSSATTVGKLRNVPLDASMATASDGDFIRKTAGAWKNITTVAAAAALAAVISIAPASISGGTAGQVLIANGVPEGAWTSLVSVELTHGRFTAGGQSGEFKTTIGGLTSFEASYAAVWLIAAATSPTSGNVTLYGDGASTYINAPGGSGSVNFVLSGSTITAKLDAVNGRFYAGGSTTAAPIVFDWATTNETQIFAGSAQTLLTIGTVSAAHIRFTGAGNTVATLETTHGAASFGGVGGEMAASIGPDLSAPTARSGVFFNAAGNTAPTSIYSDQSSITFQAVGGWVLLWSPGGLLQSTAGSFTIGTNVATRLVTIQAGASESVLQFAGGTQASLALGTHLAADAHIRSPEAFVWRGRKNDNSGDITLLQFSGDAIQFGATNAALMNFYSGGQISFQAANYVQMASSTVYLATVGGLSTIQLTADASTSTINFIQCVNASMSLAAATSDVATGDLTIQGQYAFGAATGTHRTPGSIIFDVGAPTALSTIEGSFKWSRNGTPVVTRVLNNTTGIVSDSMSSAWVYELAVGSAEMLLSTYFATGLAVWWISANDSAVYFGGAGILSAASPVIVDYTISTAPSIRGGTNADSLALQTTKSTATLTLAGGDGATGFVALTSERMDLFNLALALPNAGPQGAPFTLGGGNVIVPIDTSGGPGNIQLPDPATASWFFILIDATGSFGANPITFVRHGTETINGVASNLVYRGTDAWVLISTDQSGWYIRGF
jgi:hypothetical protein